MVLDAFPEIAQTIGKRSEIVWKFWKKLTRMFLQVLKVFQAQRRGAITKSGWGKVCAKALWEGAAHGRAESIPAAHAQDFPSL